MKQYQDLKGQLFDSYEWHGGHNPNSPKLQTSRRKELRDGDAVLVDFDEILFGKKFKARKKVVYI